MPGERGKEREEEEKGKKKDGYGMNPEAGGLVRVYAGKARAVQGGRKFNKGCTEREKEREKRMG